MTEPRRFEQFVAWSAIDPTPQGYLGRLSRHIDLSTGYAWPNRGYKIDRQVATVTNKPGASWLHRHTDGTDWAAYLSATALYPETGSDGPSALVSGLTETWNFSITTMAKPLGESHFFNGTNAEATAVRVDSAGTALEGVASFLPAPGACTPTTSGTGGLLEDGWYYVQQTWIDDAAHAAVVLESGPSDAEEIQLVAGNSTQKIGCPDPGSNPTRATKRRIYLAGPFASQQTGVVPAASFLRSASMVVAKGSPYDIVEAVTSMTIAIQSRNGVYRTAALPLTGIDISVVHLGRLFVASRTSNDVYWTERGTMQWYSTNHLSEVESQWNAPIRGMISANGRLFVFTTDSVHEIEGDFARDVEGTNPTYTANWRTRVVSPGTGATSHRAISEYGGNVFFLSTRGLAALRTNGASLVANPDIKDEQLGWDWDNMNRACSAIDDHTRSWCVAVPRKTNSSRPQDGAATSGIPDTVYRLSLETLKWNVPLRQEVVDLVWRAHGTAGSDSNPVNLYAMGPHGSLCQLNHGYSLGGPADVSGTLYDGKLATGETTTSVTAYSGLTSNAHVGQMVMLRYPDVDTNYPGEMVYRTIVSNDATTLTWVGAITVSTSTKWTARLCPCGQKVHLSADFAGVVQASLVDADWQDVIGKEASV